MEQEENTVNKSLADWMNVLIFALAGGFMIILFMFIPTFFMPDSTSHFAVNTPLCDLNGLRPLLLTQDVPVSTETQTGFLTENPTENSSENSILKEEKKTRSTTFSPFLTGAARNETLLFSDFTEELGDKTVLLIFWGPWNDPSCKMLAELAKIEKTLETEPRFRMIPVAYFANSPALILYDPENEEHRSKMIYDLQQELPLFRSVDESFNRYHFRVKTVYWDPWNAVRNGLLRRNMSGDLDYTAIYATTPDGIGFPTVMLSHHGMILAVWVGFKPEHLTEIRTKLATLLENDNILMDLSSKSPSTP